jgi:peptidyl-prolyl cis-trans isomerase B (cyclophilin B)
MPSATITTPHGDIHIELFDKTAPNTVANFVKLAKDDFYEDLSFHRVISDFMIQGGCPHSREGARGTPGTGGPGYKIDCETGPSNPEKHLPGTLSMAHAGPNTGGSQFFITHTEHPAPGRRAHGLRPRQERRGPGDRQQGQAGRPLLGEDRGLSALRVAPQEARARSGSRTRARVPRLLSLSSSNCPPK